MEKTIFYTESLSVLFSEYSLDNNIQILKETYLFGKCDSTIVHHVLGVLLMW